uniref:Uncharacterized protein n=1 Tax=Romanomermis culicivorax TaxID=13658 RepID=A0A915L3R9_ROMCU
MSVNRLSTLVTAVKSQLTTNPMIPQAPLTRMVVHKFSVEPIDARETRVIGQKIAHRLALFYSRSNNVPAIQR